MQTLLNDLLDLIRAVRNALAGLLGAPEPQPLPVPVRITRRPWR